LEYLLVFFEDANHSVTSGTPGTHEPEKAVQRYRFPEENQGFLETNVQRLQLSIIPEFPEMKASSLGST